MKFRLLVAHIVICVTFYQCGDTGFEDTIQTNFEQEVVFDPNADYYGKLVASGFTNILNELNKKDIVLTDNKVPLISKEVILRDLEKQGVIHTSLNSGARKSGDYVNPANVNLDASAIVPLEQAVEKFDYSKNQKKILRRIEKARKNSSSLKNFLRRLEKIKSVSDQLLSNEEKEVVEKILSSIYYSHIEMDKLVAAGKLPGTSELSSSEVNLTQLQSYVTVAYADNGGGGWWSSWGKCASGVVGGAIVGGLGGAYFGPWGAAIGAVGGGLLGAAEGC